MISAHPGSGRLAKGEEPFPTAGIAETLTLRKAHRGQLFLTGLVIALLLTVPVVNFLAPVTATAVMVHLFETWRIPDRAV